jgi:hypothetical protein
MTAALAALAALLPAPATETPIDPACPPGSNAPTPSTTNKSATGTANAPPAAKSAGSASATTPAPTTSRDRGRSGPPNAVSSAKATSNSKRSSTTRPP